jgi:hypothetical protein
MKGYCLVWVWTAFLFAVIPAYFRHCEPDKAKQSPAPLSQAIFYEIDSGRTALPSQ